MSFNRRMDKQIVMEYFSIIKTNANTCNMWMNLRQNKEDTKEEGIYY